MTKKREFSTCGHCGSPYPCAGRRVGYCSLECALRSRVRVAGPDDCWLWVGARNDRGYGQFRRFKTFHYAHRVAYELAHGALGERQVCHRCDNPGCCNPAHLFPGTARDNMQDMHSKGRWPADRVARGEAVGGSRLTEDDVRAIRRRIVAGEALRAIARQYCVSQGAIQGIAHGKTWKHVA